MEGAVLDWLAMLSSVRESLLYGPAQRAVGGEEEEEEKEEKEEEEEEEKNLQIAIRCLWDLFD